MIIGFTTKTSKFISKLLCKKFRHCIVIFEPADTGMQNTYILVQIAQDGIKLISIGAPQLQKLKHTGWVFIEKPAQEKHLHHLFSGIPSLLTCVGFAKRALSINKPFIWTPDGLYRYLTR
jgi:hypothetical protein